MANLKFKVEALRTLASPYRKGDKDESTFETIYYLLVDMKELPSNIPLDVNPREPKMTTNVARSLLTAVVEPETDFYINNRGIVIAAKTAEGLRVMNQKIRDRELKKYYLCIVHGTLPRPAGRLEGYILKDEAKKQVTVSSRPRPGAKTAVTLYETLAVRNGLSLVRCQLITGRTHQIRAQFAAAGHPLLGDGKYGSERQNKRYGRSYQALYSYRLEFCFTTDAGALAPLDGQQFQVEQVDFVTEYFPGFSL